MHTRTHEHTHAHTCVHTCMHTHIPTATHPQGRRERNVWVCILNVCRIISLLIRSVFLCVLLFSIFVVHDEVKDKSFELELSWVGEGESTSFRKKKI